MEYLMSYGWAVLVVLVVGVTVWQLGILESGGTIPPTATGFGGVKPLLPTCKSGPGIFELPSVSGFSCIFVNAAGGSIVVNDVYVKVNGKGCWIMLTQDKYHASPPRTYVVRWCTGEDLSTCSAAPSCSSQNTLGVWRNCALDGTWMPIENDATFFVGIYGWHGVPDRDYGPCVNGYNGGEVYNVDIDIGYLADVGGIQVQKHSVGTVRLAAD